jgi:hypothetical protein
VAEAAACLAEEIESLYVSGDYADTFNVPTNLDLTLKERIVLFDFSQVPERRRPLFYYAVLAGINHQVRRKPRKRAIIVDEVHYMNQEASLMTFMANMVKTVRTFGAGVILIDQDLEAFIGVAGAQAESMAAGLNIAAGQFILNNVSWTIAFGMKRDAAYRLAEHARGADETPAPRGVALRCLGDAACAGRADRVAGALRRAGIRAVVDLDRRAGAAPAAAAAVTLLCEGRRARAIDARGSRAVAERAVRAAAAGDCGPLLVALGTNLKGAS